MKEACRRAVLFLVGALPVLLVVLTFKLRIAPVNDLVAGATLTTLSERLLDWSRYAEIARAFAFTVVSFTQGPVDLRVGMHFDSGIVSILLLAGYLLLAGIRIDSRDRPSLLAGGAIVVLMSAGYSFVYLTTPHDLNWHLITSLNRLFLQLWPAVIFLCFMITPIPQPLPVIAPPKGERPPTSRESLSRKRNNHKTGKEIK